MSKRLNRKLSEETKEKMRQAHIGKHHSDETKNKMSKSMKKYWENIPYE